MATSNGDPPKAKVTMVTQPAPSVTVTPTGSLAPSDKDKTTVDTATKPNKAALDSENQKNNDNLTQSKDRAQITAASAMSVVHITILKALLDKGPNSKYYVLNLWLIGSSLVLQILAGIIAMSIGSLKNYYTKYHQDICADFFENLCCCKIRMKKKPKKKAASRKTKDNNSTDLQPIIQEDDENEPTQGCCPCEVTPSSYDDNEATILDAYDKWNRDSIPLNINYAAAEANITNLMATIEKEKTNIADLEKNKDSKTPEEFQAMYDEIDDRIQITRQQLQSYERVRMQWQVELPKGNYLIKAAHDIRDNRVLKMASFWQGVLTYMFYAIFVINMFITGLGFASGESKPTRQ